MMLFYKAWRESRSKFLISVLALTGYCALQVWFYQPGLPSQGRFSNASYEQYVDNQVFAGMGGGLFILLTIFLGAGGLLRERARHTAVFTLALPVRRAGLVGTQIAVGLTEVTSIAILPALLIQPLSATVDQSYLMAEALRFSVVRLICGTFIFAVSLLLSNVLKGEYTPAIASFMFLFLQNRVAEWSPLLRPYVLNPMATVNGRWQFVAGVRNIDNPLPWTGLLIMIATAIALFAVATEITKRESL